LTAALTWFCNSGHDRLLSRFGEEDVYHCRSFTSAKPYQLLPAVIAHVQVVVRLQPSIVALLASAPALLRKQPYLGVLALLGTDWAESLTRGKLVMSFALQPCFTH
jgi:hypothetical protein